VAGEKVSRNRKREETWTFDEKEDAYLKRGTRSLYRWKRRHRGEIARSVAIGE